MNHNLTKDEVGRYSRQLLVNNIGVKGQEGLKSAKVLIIGAGGLGCPVATYLAGAGIGTIGIVDYDEVAIDNLHRQVAHKEENVGKPKTESLRQFVMSLNNLVDVKCYNLLLNQSNCLDIVKEYDVVADCSDNVATRYLINDACVLAGKPLVSGSALRWEGQLTVYNADKDCPCYRCIYPVPPSPHLVTNCSEGGVIGPIVGVIGSMQALEIIKICSGNPSSFAGKLYLFDGLTGRSRNVALRKKVSDCAVCGSNPSITKLIDYTLFCGSGANDKVRTLRVLSKENRISPIEYRNLRNQTETILLDTRPPNEFEIANLAEAINIPLESMKKLSSEELEERLRINEEERPKEMFVICHRGNDSQLGVEMLKEKFPGIRIRDIIGGYESWATEIDHSFPVY